jgi:tripartite-type tricarboxylate transporter receptor subunit TctC
MARHSRRAFFAAVIGLGVSLASRPGLAQEPYYKGKTVRLLVNYPAGGATDVVARLASRYLGKHLGGFPTVAVQNMPGGGGNVGANYVYEVANPDGLTVAVFSGGYLPQILGGSGVRFDLN